MGKASDRLAAILGEALEHFRAGRLDAAEAAARRAIALDPGCAPAHERLGHVAVQRGDPAEAARAFARALAAGGEPGPLHANLAMTRQQLGDAAAAMAHYREARAIGFQHPVLDSNEAALCRDAGRLGDAETLLRRALAQQPTLAEARVNLGTVLVAAGRAEEGVAELLRAVEAAPGLASARDALLLSLHYADRVAPEEIAALHRRLGPPPGAVPRPRPRPVDPDPGRPLRIGLLSADLRRHSVAAFAGPLLAAADPGRWTVYASVARPDEVTAELRGLGHRWRDVFGLDDEAAAAAIAADRVDVLLELGGHTAGNRLGVLARRPAPLQATWLGYPNTTGMAEVDLRITDAVADPDVPGAPWHAESLCRLPGGFLAWRPALEPPVGPRAPGPVRFGSFNHLAKISPVTLRLWRDVLAAAPGSTLLVKSSVLSDPQAAEAFRARARAAGLDPRRLALQGHVAGEADHLAALAEVDVALDSWPYHGTTTTLETLWMGVPVVTLAGRAHVSRVSASILAHAGLSELVAPSPEVYVAIAAGLAGDAGRRAALRVDLRDRLRASPLLDPARLARELEAAFAEAWRALLAGLR